MTKRTALAGSGTGEVAAPGADGANGGEEIASSVTVVAESMTNESKVWLFSKVSVPMPPRTDSPFRPLASESVLRVSMVPPLILNSKPLASMVPDPTLAHEPVETVPPVRLTVPLLKVPPPTVRIPPFIKPELSSESVPAPVLIVPPLKLSASLIALLTFAAGVLKTDPGTPERLR